MSCGASCCCFLPCSPMARGGGGPCLADGPAAHCLYMLRVCRLCIWCWRRLGTLFFVLPRRQRQALNRVFYFTLRMHTHAHTLPYRLLVYAYALYVCVCVLNRFGARFHLYHSLVYDGIPCSRVYFCVPASAAAVLFINILGGRCSCRWWSPSLHFGSI